MASGKLILITKLKGGSGSTTTARELACAAMLDGKRVALIDLDGQGSLSRWWGIRTKGLTKGEPVNPDLLKIPIAQVGSAAKSLRRDYDVTIIDSPPTVHESIKDVASHCDLAVVPARPTADDLAAISPIARLLKGTIDLVFVLTQIPSGGRSRDGMEALELLAAKGPVMGITTFRTDYYRPAAMGFTGVEKGKTAPPEIDRIYRNLIERMAL